MQRTKFDESELIPKGEYPGRGSVPATPKLNFTVTPKENLMAIYRKEKPLWIPFSNQQKFINPVILPDNIARGFVMEKNVLPADKFGGKDMFGVGWYFEKSVGGSMVVPGNPKVKDLCEWEKYVIMPQVESWDWENNAAQNEEYCNTDEPLKSTIFSGFFERLISFVDFEEAALAMIDDEQQEDVHRLFSILCDIYEKIINNLVKFYHIDILNIHDDWGTQRAPFFSLDTCMEMVVPYMKRISKCCHNNGIFLDLHSCGYNEMLVPAMIEAGVDSWQPQTINDTQALYEQFGKDIILSVIPDNVPTTTSDAEIDILARAYVDKYAEKYADTPFIACFTPVDAAERMFIDPRFTTAVYKYSRLAFEN